VCSPNLCAAGGFSECRKIATLASALRQSVMRPHAWGSAIGLAATVSSSCGTWPDQPPAFRPMPPMLEFEQTAPTRCAITWRSSRSSRRRGSSRCRRAHGLGIEIDREVLRKVQGGLESFRPGRTIRDFDIVENDFYPQWYELLPWQLPWELADQLEPENGMLWKDLIAACIRHVTFASLQQRGITPRAMT